MNESTPLIDELRQTRQRFLDLVGEIRPDLHRYCARMLGSIADGEDVVQDALARAYYQLPELRDTAALRSWLFRIAHNQALDALRKRERDGSESMETTEAAAKDEDADAVAATAREHALGLAMERFLELSPLQRSCIVLKDVLGYTLDDIASMLDSNVTAIKAALHRGRLRTRELSERGKPRPQGSLPDLVRRYVELFNARDWDGVKSLLVDDVRLDLVSVSRRTGREDVGTYFSNYGHTANWHLRAGWLDAQPAIAVFTARQDMIPAYIIDLELREDGVARIRDFRYVPYIAREAQMFLEAGT
jgi:RNA polymerase sigma-70 factor (ECF subfamily)